MQGLNKHGTLSPSSFFKLYDLPYLVSLTRLLLPMFTSRRYWFDVMLKARMNI